MSIHKQFREMMEDVARFREIEGTPKKKFTTKGLLEQLESYEDPNVDLHIRRTNPEY